MVHEGYIDRPTAFFHEMHSQVDDYNPERFRRFYRDHIGERLDPESDALKLGADFIRTHYFYTISGCDMDAGFFGDPRDPLITPDGELSPTALRSLKRIREFRASLKKLPSDPGALFPRPGFPLRDLSIALFAGRRSLGPKAHETFRKLAAKYLRIKSTGDRGLFRAHSFDSVIDEAMGLALSPFPFPNQDLLKKILDTTENARVIEEALDRLDAIQENAEIFERHVADAATERSGIRGVWNIEKLRDLRSQDDWSDALRRTRIAILEKDVPAVERIATSETFYDSVHMALESIEDPATLTRIRPKIKGDTPRDVISRCLIDAKLAAGAGDVAKVEQLLADYRKANPYNSPPHVLFRVKARMEAELKIAPQVFLSYRHESDEHRLWVKNFAQNLRHNGINALLDEWEINLGDSIADFASSAIFRVQAMLFLITEASVAAVESDEKSRSVVKFEFQIANARRYKDGNFRIIGILRGGVRPPNHLADTLYLDFRRDENYEVQLKR